MATYERGRNVIAVGLLATVSALGFLALFAWLTERGFAIRRAEVLVEVPTAERLKKGDEVLFKGVPVGEVTALTFLPRGTVLIRTRLNREVPLNQGATAQLQAVDVFGTQAVVFENGPAGLPPLAPGDTIAGTAAGTLMGRTEDLAQQVQRFLGDTTLTLIRGFLAGGTEVAVELEELIAGANSMLASQRGDVGRITENVASVTGNLNRATEGEELTLTLENLERASANLASTAEGLDRTARDLAAVLEGVRAGEGSMGLLVNDTALYRRVTGALAGLESLLEDLRRNPKRYINISVF